MKKTLLTLIILGSILAGTYSVYKYKEKQKKIEIVQFERDLKKEYKEYGLKGRLDFDVFSYAMEGLREIDPPKKDYIAIIDYRKDSTEKRLFLLDLKNKKVDKNLLVSHGRKTGVKDAEEFSNIEGSNQTSLGFYLTEETYVGQNGYSLRLEGLDGIHNSEAKRRYIVLHGAWYVSEEHVKKYGRLGRSLGCPAVENSVAKEVIDKLKNGNLILHYAEKNGYPESSVYYREKSL